MEDATTDQKLEGNTTDPRGPGAAQETKDDSAVTPVTRLTWRDLIEPSGAAEDETHTSPNDTLLWDDTTKDLQYLSALSPMMPRKGRKRARSSSPISSPAADKPITPAVNVKKLAQALKSPHPDPTLKLWDRYSIGGRENADTPLGISNSALAQLMVSSSPRPAKGATAQTGDSNLRRAISCGLNWPKRRKVEKSSLGSRASGEKRDSEVASKSSLVTQLLDTVTSSIQGQSEGEGEDEAVESPSPKKRYTAATKSSSPTRPMHGNIQHSSATSDYGDEDFGDFDDDALMELEASINATQLDSVTKPRDSGSQAEATAQGIQTDPIVLDEFEDLDDDIFDGAENLIKSVESQYNSQAPAQTPTPKPRFQSASRFMEDVRDVEDEFGDAFVGDFDFEAVELAATQAVQQSKDRPIEVGQKPQARNLAR